MGEFALLANKNFILMEEFDTMKKRTKSLLVAFSTIAVCGSLIAGSTYALFTSQSSVNIAVTSGQVEVKASIKEGSINTYSATTESKGTDSADNTVNYTKIVDETYSQYYYKPYTTNGTTQGELYSGSVVIEDGDITLTNILPGDKVEFTVEVVNTSNVTISYRSLFQIVSDDGLYSGLSITVGSDVYSNCGTVVSEWVSTSETFDTYYDVVIELPISAGNEYKNKNCKINYAVEAVQGNAAQATEATVKDANGNAFKDDENKDIDTEYQSLAQAIKVASLYANSVVTPTTTVNYAVVIPENKGLTIDMNGKDISVTGTNSSFAVKNSGSAATLKLSGVTINGVSDETNSTALASALTISSGEVNVNAVGTNTFTGAKGGSGIEIKDDATVTITGDTINAYGNNKLEYFEKLGENNEVLVDSSLYSTGDESYSVGGSGIQIDSNNVVINGVRSIVAEGYGVEGYGIGGNATLLTIKNTTISYARGGFAYNINKSTNKDCIKYIKHDPIGGAAIGLRTGTISLDTVVVDKAEGGGKSAAIGGISSVGDITVNITECTLKDIIGGYSAAAIGGGRANHVNTNTIEVNIVSSTINATGGRFGAAIGSGYDSNTSGYTKVIINIDKDLTSNYSTINAVAGERAAGIGTGFHVGYLVMNIKDDTNIKATAGAPYLDDDGNVKYIEAQAIGFGVVDQNAEYANSKNIYNVEKVYDVTIGTESQNCPFVEENSGS
jgi:hypothetical protein